MELEYQLFIDKFKRVEQAVKQLPAYNDGSPVKFLEDFLDGTSLQTKLRMCRNVRNYIQHEPDYADFIRVSQGMLDCLDEILASIESHYAQQLTKAALVNLAMPLSSVVNVVKQRGHAILVDGNGVFVTLVTPMDVVRYVATAGYTGTAMDIPNVVGVNRMCEFIAEGAMRTPGKICLVTQTGSFTEPIKGELE